MNISNYELRDFLSWCWTNPRRSRIIVLNAPKQQPVPQPQKPQPPKKLSITELVGKYLESSCRFVQNYNKFGRASIGKCLW